MSGVRGELAAGAAGVGGVSGWSLGRDKGTKRQRDRGKECHALAWQVGDDKGVGCVRLGSLLGWVEGFKSIKNARKTGRFLIFRNATRRVVVSGAGI